MLIGIVLLIGVTLLGLALGWRAADSVQKFREEHHESFLGKGKP